jgi:SNF2 family DNA or RNA helicase
MMEGIVETKLTVYSKKGRALREAATLAFTGGRIEFLKSPFSLKDEIKAMKGSKWHGFDDEPRKIWSVTDCFRNRFQLGYLQGEDVYAWFDRELVRHEYQRPLRDYQRDLCDNALTYHFQIWAAEMGLGKTLAAIEVMEKSGAKDWWYAGPKKPLEAIKREFKKWGIDPSLNIELLTYEALTRRMDEWTKDQPFPQGVIFDESSRLKTADSQRARAAQFLADLIRSKYGHDGYVILMSGTPSPKTPVDWWSQAEIAYPGFLKEGSERAFRMRLGFVQKRQFGSGGVHNDLIGWKDDEHKCAVCGQEKDNSDHDFEIADPDAFHAYEQSINEVELMYSRLKGLVVIKKKKDCVDLPDKQYRKIVLKPLPSTLRVAQALSSSSANAATAATLLRELSDGFQYREIADGTTSCPTCNHGEGCTGQVSEWFDPADEDRAYSSVDMLNPELVGRLEERLVTCPQCDGKLEVPKMTRIAREVPCPKEDAIRDLLAENEEHGRIVIFAGFTGSVDRCVKTCLSEDWHVVRCDGRGFHVQYRESDGEVKNVRDVPPLDYWADLEKNPRVAFVAHPESGGMGLTLTEASMAVFYSNSYKPEYRSQSEDRIHRLGMDDNRGATIVDLIHLPTDERALQIIRENRKLELMSLGEFIGGLKFTEE